MRLIGSFPSEKQAYQLYAFLLQQNIPNIYEATGTPKGKSKEYSIWIYDENDLDAALHWLEEYRKDPTADAFQVPGPPAIGTPPTPTYNEVAATEETKWQNPPAQRVRWRPVSFVLTRLLIILCGILFLWDSRQEEALVKKAGPLATQIAMTPLEQTLFFDEPAGYPFIQQLLDTIPLEDYQHLTDLPPEGKALLEDAQQTPGWQGLAAFINASQGTSWSLPTSFMAKIRQGEFWRLFTPCLMHRDLLHILFNMVWAWVLLKQIESRLPRRKLLVLVLIIGVVSNVAQYLASGPYFLGFSGVIVGLATFIWMRQKKRPWEGYTLHRSTLLFLLFFVVAMCAVEFLAWLLSAFSLLHVTPHIANTAHVVGGLVGLGLGRLRFFDRRHS